MKEINLTNLAFGAVKIFFISVALVGFLGLIYNLIIDPSNFTNL